MRYLVFGDIHGNLEALDTVLAAAGTLEVGAYLCVGDIVGYGPCPLECLAQLAALHRQGKLVWVAGNHELALRDEVDPSAYSPEAQATLAWTRSLIESWKWAREFLAAAEVRSQVNEEIWLTHDSLSDPSTGRYQREVTDAKRELISLWKCGGRVGFYGHTHTQRAEVLRPGEVITVPMAACGVVGRDPQPVDLVGRELGWMGVGSVGFPTNRERRVEFLILDDADRDCWKVEKYALAYPREQAREHLWSVVSSACGKEIAGKIMRWL